MYSTAEAARRIGVCKNTLLRWISDGLMPDVDRDERSWRVWFPQDIHRARAFKKSYRGRAIARRQRPVAKAEYARSAAESMVRFGRALQWAPRSGS